MGTVPYQISLSLESELCYLLLATDVIWWWACNPHGWYDKAVTERGDHLENYTVGQTEVTAL